jgi:glycosyltransferase involved in cell wall biosynthesis
MNVAFHSNSMTLRGSENALWDYANFNEEILGNHSLICHPAKLANKENPIYAKWKARFPLVPYRTKAELSSKLKERGVDILYQIKPGHYDGFVIPSVKNCIHSMFLSDEFHGDRFAYVSRWASRVMTGGEESFVPHFVPKFESKLNLRQALGIPAKAKVFGRHGGWDTFNIPFVRKTLIRQARQNTEDHFIFLNTEPIRGTERLENVHYLTATVDADEKASFLATCDAMLHARLHGETFGLAVGEFAVLGKPVITYGGSRERAHLEMLGAEAVVYENERGLEEILRGFAPRAGGAGEYGLYQDPYYVMKLFAQGFLWD